MDNPQPTRLPLWKLELFKDQAERRLKRAEEAHLDALAEVRRLKDEIEARRKEQA
jgi:hypothetical protein